MKLSFFLALFFLSFDISADTKTLGHIGSFFKQSERPSQIVDYVDATTNRLKIDEMYPNLLQLEANYFAYGFWVENDRSIYAWEDFREVLSRLQSDRPDISLYLYVGSPEYANGQTFCWDDVITNAQCQHPSNYDDYIRWAKEAALLNSEFSIVKGILIDDFTYSLSTHDSDTKLFTPTYLDQIKQEGSNIFPDFRVETIWYLPAISAYHAKRVSGHIDAVHFFYRHFDGDRIDPDPDRIANEIEMFSRAFSANEASLISVFRELDKPAITGKVMTIEGTIDISAIQEDLSIAYWDSLYSSDVTSLYGWTKIKLYFEDQLLLEQDIMDGASDNGLQTLQVAYANIQSLQDAGQNQAQVRLEIITLQDYSQWGYTANLFILSPSSVPVTWASTDEEESHIVVTNNDIPTAIDRYIGLYGGTHSAFDVSAEYTQRLLSHAAHALKADKVEGLVSWEVMMNPADSGVFSLYKDYFKGDLSPSILISPLHSHQTPVTTFKWNASVGSTWYYIWVQDYISREVTTKWYSAESAGCLEGGLCTVAIPEVIHNGLWWVRTWNANGNGPWSNGEHFTSGDPTRASLLSPSGSTNSRPVMIWHKISNASWYHLWIEDSTGANVINRWYSVDEADCSQANTNTCEITIDTDLLGEYKWWVRGWNATAYGEWSYPLSFLAQ